MNIACSYLKNRQDVKIKSTIWQNIISDIMPAENCVFMVSYNKIERNFEHYSTYKAVLNGQQTESDDIEGYRKAANREINATEVNIINKWNLCVRLRD